MWQVSKTLLFILIYGFIFSQQDTTISLKGLLELSEDSTSVKIKITPGKLYINDSSETIRMDKNGLFINDSSETIVMDKKGIIIQTDSEQIVINKNGIFINTRNKKTLSISPSGSYEEDDQKQEDEHKHYHKKTYPYWSSGFILELGVNNYLSSEGIGLPTAYDTTMSLKPASFHSAIYYVGKYNLTEYWAFRTGIGIDINRASFNSNATWGRDSVKVYVARYPEDVVKNRFKTVSLVVPLMINWQSSGNLGFGIGGYVGLIIDSKHKIKYLNGSGAIAKAKIPGSYNLNQLRYGVKLQFKFANSLGLYVNYDLSPYFKEGSTQNNFKQFAVGVVLS